MPQRPSCRFITLLLLLPFVAAQQDSASCNVSCRFVVFSAIGPPGVNGTTGPEGPNGPVGATGQTGPQGPQGIMGATGQTGPQGIQGVAGPQGVKGDKGDRGETGATGQPGQQGIQGIQGAPAEKTVHLIGNSEGLIAATNAALGSGAGTGAATVSFAAGSTDSAGVITITTGGKTAANSLLLRVTYKTPYSTTAFTILQPGNRTAAALSGDLQIYIDTQSSTHTHFDIWTGAKPLTANTQYSWLYHAIG